MPAKTHTTRLDVRLAEPHKKLIERAAGLMGQTVTTFTVATLLREAEDVVYRFGMLHLSDRDRDAFVKALDKAPAPSARLRKAARAHARNAAK